MSERGEVSFGDALIRYEVVRSARRHKTIEVTVDEPGLVTVAAPVSTSVEQLEATVRGRAGWIIRHDGAASAAHSRVLGRRRPGRARLPPATRAPPGDRAPPQRLSYPPSTLREHLPTRPSRFPDRRLVATGGRLYPSQNYARGNSTATKSKQFRSVFGKARPDTQGWPARGVRTARASAWTFDPHKPEPAFVPFTRTFARTGKGVRQRK